MSQHIFAAETAPTLPNLDANFTELYGLTAWSATGIGYVTGAGGAVTQLTNKSTSVTLNKVCGQITMNGAALASGATATFTLVNSTIAASDVVVVSVGTGATGASYRAHVSATAASAVGISVTNFSGGSLSEAIVLNFAVIKAVAS